MKNKVIVTKEQNGSTVNDGERVLTPPASEIIPQDEPPSTPHQSMEGPPAHVYAQVTITDLKEGESLWSPSASKATPVLGLDGLSPSYSPMSVDSGALSSQDSVALSGESSSANLSQDMFITPLVPDLLPDGGHDDDRGSLASDDDGSIMSDLSSCADAEEQFSVDSIKKLLKATFHARKVIQKCFEYYPNIKTLAKHLIKFRSQQQLTTAQRIRIQRLIDKIKRHIKTTGSCTETFSL